MNVVMVCSSTELDSGIFIHGSSISSASGPQSARSSAFKDKSSLLFMSGDAEFLHSIVF